jgi:hypothetical protein
MLVKTKLPVIPMRLANLPFAANQRPGRACLFGIHGPQLCPPLPRASMTPPLIVDSFLSAKAALSSHHMPCSAFLSGSCEQTLGLGAFLLFVHLPLPRPHHRSAFILSEH